jgi:DivIVA domain-containing protein
MRKKRADDEGVPMQGDGRVTPEDIQSVEFRLSFRGYNERDVDAFLDRLTTDLSGYLAELAELRGGAPVRAMVGGDTTAAQNEAQQILSRAREQAAAIVRQAEQQAAAIGAGAGAATASGDTRAAVAPFLNTEREFLQQLGSLVQTHAEEIKQMVLTLRSREGGSNSDVAPATSAPASSAAPAAARPAPPAEDVGGASAAEMRERMGTTEPPASAERHVTIDSGTEPAFSSEGAPAGDARERSLRELFWGED